jgi:hypothetical protein
MKKLSVFVLACALLSPAAVLAADFEGKVHFKISSGGKGAPQELDYGIKNGLVRIDIQTKEAGTPGVILNGAKQEVTILMPEQQMYMVQSIAGKNSAGAAGPAGDDVKLEKAGVTEKILGYDCEKYTAKTKEGTSEMWVTDQLGSFMGFGPGAGGPPMGGRRGSPSSGAAQAWESALAGKNFFPLRVVTLSAKGQETTRMEATAIEKKSLPDSDFTPPAGWQKLDMGAMMRGMMPGGR